MIWYQVSLRVLLSGGIVVAASELAKRSSVVGALLISLPLASMMTLMWLHHDGQDAEQLALFSKEVLWLVIPSLAFFLTLPLLLNNGLDFIPAILLSSIFTAACYAASLYALSVGLATG
ncbi:MAG: DUF3147 family protein [Candidatus Poseidoniaceae archaeon]|nr:DUF3147 family protein [Candidatus Poseidoniaceae archaeon]MDG1556543.1 DUF3147 family protein [Candidatus Poseidoniaceae archaeon]